MHSKDSVLLNHHLSIVVSFSGEELHRSCLHTLLHPKCQIQASGHWGLGFPNLVFVPSLWFCPSLPVSAHPKILSKLHLHPAFPHSCFFLADLFKQHQFLLTALPLPHGSTLWGRAGFSVPSSLNSFPMSSTEKHLNGPLEISTSWFIYVHKFKQTSCALFQGTQPKWRLIMWGLLPFPFILLNSSMTAAQNVVPSVAGMLQPALAQQGAWQPCASWCCLLLVACNGEAPNLQIGWLSVCCPREPVHKMMAGISQKQEWEPAGRFPINETSVLYRTKCCALKS